MDQAVDCGDGDGGIGEDAIPGAEGLVGGDGEASCLVSAGDELEEDGGLGLVLLGVADVVEDDQVEAVELGQRGLEDEVAAGGLEALHKVCRAGVEHTAAGFDKGVAYGAEQVRLAGSRVPDRDEVAPRLDPVACREGFDLPLRHRGDGGEVERGQRLAAGEAGLGEVAADAAGLALGQLELGQGRK